MNGSNSLGAIHATMTYKEGMPKDQNLEKNIVFILVPATAPHGLKRYFQ
jgi:hypothetical protein